MKIVTLKELVPTEDHQLWWLVHRPYFSEDVLNCAAAGYVYYSQIPPELRSAGGGPARYNTIMRELRPKLQREYGATIKKHRGQTRFAIQGPGPVYVETIVLKCCPADGGFSAAPAGPTTEQLSLMPMESLQYEPGVPSGVGMLLAHYEEEPGWVTMWLAHEWRAREGSKLIECPVSAELGRIQYDREIKPREDTGETPDL